MSTEYKINMVVVVQFENMYSLSAVFSHGRKDFRSVNRVGKNTCLFMDWSGKSEDCDEFTRNNSEVLGSSIHCH